MYAIRVHNSIPSESLFLAAGSESLPVVSDHSQTCQMQFRGLFNSFGRRNRVSSPQKKSERPHLLSLDFSRYWGFGSLIQLTHKRTLAVRLANVVLRIMACTRTFFIHMHRGNRGLKPRGLPPHIRHA